MLTRKRSHEESQTGSQKRWRFDSFAPERNGNRANWFVDGQDYMSSVADAINSAEKEILIADWQMNPYIFMKRPDNGVNSLEWRLDKMLFNKADQGVRVYILLYWETRLAMDLGSSHTISLLNEHDNISVRRHPSNANVALHLTTMCRWSTHEKIVVVDRKIAFVGGIDLCFGRWDTRKHELKDDYPVHPFATEEATEEGIEERPPDTKKYCRWIDQDYRNTFLQGTDSLDRSKDPRMPWHDVACVFSGPAVDDVVKHFLQRCSAAGLEVPTNPPKSKVKSNSSYSIPNTYGQLNIQALRSVTKWSAGQPHENSIYNAYLHAIKNSKHYIYIENQFFISSESGILTKVRNEIQSALVERIYRAYDAHEDFHVMIMMPLKPEFGPEDWLSSMHSRTITYWNYATIFNGEESLLAKLEKKGMPAKDISRYFSVYGLRTHDTLSSGPTTEIIYVHSKVMIVDDLLTIIGSANINDRSMVGDKDSEIAVIMEDVDMIDITWKDTQLELQVGKFSHSLRCNLQKEHLGLLNPNGDMVQLNVEDPLASSFNTCVLNQASQNTLIYEEVFGSRILPTNMVMDDEHLERWKNTQGLVDMRFTRVAENELKRIRGNIVCIPRFFSVKTLRRSFLRFWGIYT